jgi:serine/threonine-protein kinase HipA
MKQGKFDIYVFADWKGMAAPKLMGILSAHYGKGKKAFGFEYDKDWIKTASQRLIDPDIQFFRVHNFQTIKKILEFF